MYTTVYDLDSTTLWKAYVLPPGGVSSVLVVLAIGVACVLVAVLYRRPIFLLGLAPFILVTSFFGPVLLREYQWGRSLLDLYRSGGCRIAEGRTRVLALQRPEGHSIDRIDIGGVTLEVSHFELGPQYRDSIAYGGVLRDGVEARVWYCPQRAVAGSPGPIVRVDVKRP